MNGLRTDIARLGMMEYLLVFAALLYFPAFVAFAFAAIWTWDNRPWRSL